MKLSILIPTTPDRKDCLNDILKRFESQCGGLKNIAMWKSNGMEFIRNIYFNKVEVNVLSDNKTHSIGFKRNLLYETCKGKYCASFDSDDSPSEEYIPTALSGIENKPDCLSLRGIMTTDGHTPEIFEHSIKYNEWRTTENEIKYERYPNHLNIIRADIAKQFKFPETNFGEDFSWSKAIHESGLLKNEVYIDQVLYYYKFRTKK